MMFRTDGRHREVGSAGSYRPGPPARPVTRLRFLVLTALLVPFFVAMAIPAPTGTRALYSSEAAPQTNTITGGEWGRPTPPAACGPVSDYKGGVVYGTPGDDVIDLRNANQSQIIMGLGGNDTIYGGNSGDCLVGGDGNDKLYGGNAKDILIGGPGNDYLDGGNGVDTLDGGDGTDVCVGGRAPDVSTNCESTP